MSETLTEREQELRQLLERPILDWLIETPERGAALLFREDLGDGVWLVGFRSINRQTATIGLEMAETHRFDDRTEYRRVIREKMQVLGDRLMEAW